MVVVHIPVAFVLEPVVDFTSVHQFLDSIPVQFGPDLTEALDLGKDRGLVSSIPDSTRNTMADLAQSWDNTLLEESNHRSFITYVGLVCGGFKVLVIRFCIIKECWQCYVWRKEMAGLLAMIRDQMTMEMRPMLSGGWAHPDLAQTAPADNSSST